MGPFAEYWAAFQTSMCQMLVIWSITSAGAMIVYYLNRQAALCRKDLLMVIDFEMWS